MKTRKIDTIETSNYRFRYADDFVEVDKDSNLVPLDLLDPVLELLHHVEELRAREEKMEAELEKFRHRDFYGHDEWEIEALTEEKK